MDRIKKYFFRHLLMKFSHVKNALRNHNAIFDQQHFPLVIIVRAVLIVNSILESCCVSVRALFRSRHIRPLCYRVLQVFPKSIFLKKLKQRAFWFFPIDAAENLL